MNGGSQPVVLLAEDDRSVRDSLVLALQVEGYEVDATVDGEAAIKAFEKQVPDVVVLDVMMPKVDGLGVCRRIRDADSDVPVLMLTARHEISDRVAGLDAGADDYLVKPFSFPVLVARVRALLRRAGGRDPAPLRVGRLRIDPGGRRVWHDDQEVFLTTREFEVLEFLIRREGQVLSKSQILAGVWSDEFDGDPNIVEVYIGRLRRKIDGPDDLDATITTVRGAGYRLGVD
jgi:two-component system OmpR family response regulator